MVAGAGLAELIARESAVPLVRRIAPGILNTIADATSTGVDGAIGELISNGWDADANNLRLLFYRDELTVTDDGSGMLPSGGLVDFYTSGESKKKHIEFTPIYHRQPLGHFGIAVNLIRYLSRSNTVTTWRDGVETVVTEADTREVKPGVPLDKIVRASTHPGHGTIIQMRNLSFKEGDGFCLQELMRNLQWSFFPDPNFKIFVNGTEITCKPLESADQFDVHAALPDAGLVTGTVYLLNRPTDRPGLYVYVRKHRTGDPKGIVSWSSLKGGLADRVVGMIHADGLNDYVQVNKASFIQSTPYRQLQAVLRDVLLQVRAQYERKAPEKRVVHLSAALPKIAKDVSEQMSKIEGNPRVSVTVDGATSSGELGEYDSRQGKITINKKHPLVAITPTMSTVELRRSVLAAAVDVMALHLSKDDPDQMQAFQDARARMFAGYAKLCIPKGAASARFTLLPSMFYPLEEIADYCGISTVALGHVVKSGALATKDDKITGKSALAFEKRVKGFVPLYDMVQRDVPSSQAGLFYERVWKTFGNAGDAFKPFVLDLGQPACYFVYELCQKSLKTHLLKRLSQPVSYAKPDDAVSAAKRICNEYGERVLSLGAIATALEEKPQRAVALLGLIQQERVPLTALPHAKKSDQKAYSFKEFIAAVQQAYQIIDARNA